MTLKIASVLCLSVLAEAVLVGSTSDWALPPANGDGSGLLAGGMRGGGGRANMASGNLDVATSVNSGGEWAELVAAGSKLLQIIAQVCPPLPTCHLSCH